MPRRAFTLIELLVVVGILALLIALLLPSLARAQRQARAVACKTQLQQLGQAMTLYQNANRGWYPNSPALPSVNPHNLLPIYELLSPHLNNDLRVFKCPADEVVHPVENTSYFYYQELGVRRLQQTFLYRISQSASDVPVLWDADNYHGGDVPYNWLFADGHVNQFLRKAQ